MPTTFTRDRFTWMAYLLLGLFAYFSNVLGPVTPFLKDELSLSYTATSLHFTALAVGILAVGTAGPLVIARIGRLRAMWLGAAGMSLGALLLAAGRSLPVTVPGPFLMGGMGALVLATIFAALSDIHGEASSAVIAEANAVAVSVGASAPLLVGWSALISPGWRLALVIPALAVLPLALSFRGARFPRMPSSGLAGNLPPLPRRYWRYWTAIMLSEAAEYCLVFWSATYLETLPGMSKAGAAQAVSLFLAAMIVGRLAGSRLLRRVSPAPLFAASILLALAGFVPYWAASRYPLALFGLFVTGLGIAMLYPLAISMAIASAPGNSLAAGARATLSTGSSILVLPLVLGRIADQTGLRAAYILVPLLLLSALVLIMMKRN